jgi:hypothetical protein
MAEILSLKHSWFRTALGWKISTEIAHNKFTRIGFMEL